jgi:pimeloyl-ACP methyl ester carboxylesterase
MTVVGTKDLRTRGVLPRQCRENAISARGADGCDHFAYMECPEQVRQAIDELLRGG